MVDVLYPPLARIRRYKRRHTRERTDMTTIPKLGHRQRQRFEEARHTGYLVDPTPDGHRPSLALAWKSYCLEHDLPFVVVSKMEGSGGRYARVYVLADARSHDDHEHTFGEGWGRVRREALDRFGVEDGPGRSRESVVWGGGDSTDWSHFENFPAATVEGSQGLAAFLVEKAREHRLPCESNNQIVWGGDSM